MFIAIEGGDASGKTTLCPTLAQMIQGVSYRTPPEHYEKTREKIDRNASPVEKYRYYKEGIIEASSEIKELVQAGKHVIVDRYWLTTLVYHEIIGVPASRSDFGDILEPDLTILLSLSPEIQVQRMTKRGLSIRDRQMIDRQEEIAFSYYRHILRHKIPFVALDTMLLRADLCARICGDIVDSIIHRGH